ncbi:LOW QUALITY PROTEIN: hypothetical protein ACHAW5_008803 [Stephanodiscus triporus]|uniref:DDE Tnp4 domain-containing protein n=1 Tax=Stephanodiscus triporus TaxID=2934178 RepID=A0ABD3P8F0_9STRA
MNVKSVMSFGLELVGFGAKRQNVRDKLNLQRFRSHFGIGPEAINALYFKIPEGKKLIGDSGYKGEPSKISTSVDEHSDKNFLLEQNHGKRQSTLG